MRLLTSALAVLAVAFAFAVEARHSARRASELNLEAGKAATGHTLSLMYNRYQMFDPDRYGVYLLRSFLGTDLHTWDILKYKFALKMLEGGQKFLAVFAGSSVTAGHDNFLNESYPEVYERRMRAPLEALGIEFEMHNIAMGGQGCFPQNLCYESQGGDDADIYSWEQSYFCKGPPETAMAQLSAVHSRNYGVFMYQRSGAVNYDLCKAKKEIQPKDYSPVYSEERWTPADAGLEEWKPTAEDIRRERDTSAASVPSKGELNAITGIQTTGAWDNNNRTCRLPNCVGGKNCECNQFNVITNYCQRLEFFNDDVGKFHSTGHGARHHPTGAMHLMRGESNAWYHATILMDAIYMVEHDMERGETREALIAEYRRVLDALHPPARTVFAKYNYETNLFKTCEKWYCLEAKLECYNDFRPRWNPRLSLFNQMVNQGNWLFQNFTLNAWQLHAGYLDTPVLFVSTDQSAISFKFHNPKYPKVILHGNAWGRYDYVKNCTYYAEVNVPAARLVKYVRPAGLKPLTFPIAKPAYIELENVPVGEIVLTMENCPVDTPVSHIMTFVPLDEWYENRNFRK